MVLDTETSSRLGTRLKKLRTRYLTSTYLISSYPSRMEGLFMLKLKAISDQKTERSYWQSKPKTRRKTYGQYSLKIINFTDEQEHVTQIGVRKMTLLLQWVKSLLIGFYSAVFPLTVTWGLWAIFIDNTAVWVAAPLSVLSIIKSLTELDNDNTPRSA